MVQQGGGEGEKEMGWRLLDESLSLYESIPDKVGQTNIYNFKMQWFAQQGDGEKALFFGQKALALARSFIPDHPFTVWLAQFVAGLAEANE